MASEEAKKVLTNDELKKKAEELTLQFNECYQEKKFDEAEKLNTEIEQTVNEYTNRVRQECFDALKASDDPMLEAVKQLSFTTIRIRDTKEGDGKVKISVRVVEEIEKPIDLLKLHNYVGGDGIGKDKNWAYMIEQMDYLLSVQRAMGLNVKAEKLKELRSSYAMNEIAKQISLGKTPTSKTNMLNTLNKIVAAMIGEEYKAKSYDVNFLLDCFAKKSRKALTISLANHRSMRQYMAEVCHRIVTGESYDVQYQKNRK